MHQTLYPGQQPMQIINAGLHELPIVVSFPHSGTLLTDAMLHGMRDDTILTNMDWYLPELYGFLADMGFTMLINRMSRYVIDPNRDLKAQCGGDYRRSLIYDRTTFGKEIYRQAISAEEADSRVHQFYAPYHNTLRNLIVEKQKYFPTVYLFDLHSFGKDIGADVVLGNGNGKTMHESMTQYITALFESRQFSVMQNQPFPGGYITRHYGEAYTGCESMQIELLYRAYMEHREFGEEEMPTVNQAVMRECRDRLYRIFSSLKQKLTI